MKYKHSKVNIYNSIQKLKHMKLELLKNGVDQTLAFLKVTQKYMEQFAITVTEENIDLRFMDPSHVCMGRLLLENNKHYKLDSLMQSLDGITFELRTKDVMKILSRIEDNTTIINAEVEDNTILGVNFIVKGNETNTTLKEIQIPAYEYEQNAKINELVYDQNIPKARIEIDNLVNSLAEIKDYDVDVLYLELNQQAMTLTATSTDNVRKKIKINKFDSLDFEDITAVDTDITIAAFFTMEYLHNLIVTNPAYKSIDIAFNTDKPLEVTYVDEASQDNNLVCLIAPKLRE